MIIRSTASKFAAAGLAGTMMLAVASPSLANDGRTAAAVGGFAAGALLGSAVADSYHHPRYYGPGYAYAPDYGPRYSTYSPRYSAYAAAPAYEPGYSAYAYAPGPIAGSRGDYVVSKDNADQPIYQGDLSPFCNFGDKLNEQC